MRPRVAWMTATDDAILEFLDDLESVDSHPVWMSARLITVNVVEERRRLDRSNTTIQRRLNEMLTDAGLVARRGPSAPQYRITDLGRRYLHDELTDAEIDELRKIE